MSSDNKVTVVIAGDNQVSKTLNKIQGDLSGFGGAISGIGRLLGGLAIGEAVSKLLEFGKASLETADNFAKMSQRTGVSVSDLSALTYAAKLSGAGLEGLEIGLKKLNKSLSDAAAGSRQAQIALHDVGVKPNQYKSTTDALGAIADKFAKMKDGPDKAALALQIFGRQGTQLIPLLNEGSKGIARLREEAERLGVVLSDKDVAQAQELHDNIERLKFAAEGLTQHFLSGLIPALNQVFNATTQAGDGLDVAHKAGELLGDVVKLLALGFEALGIGAAFAAHKLGLLADAMLQFGSGNFKAAAQSMSQMVGDATDAQGDFLRNKLGQVQQKLFPDDPSQVPKLRSNADLDEARRTATEIDAINKLKLKKQMEDLKLSADFSKSMNEIELAQVEELYKHQLISVEDFFGRKKKLQADSLQAEIFALEQEKALQASVAGKGKDPATKEQAEARIELSKLTEQLTVKTAQLNAVLGKTPSGDDDPLRQHIQQMEIAAAEAERLAQAIDQVFSDLKRREEEIARQVQTYQITAIDGENAVNVARADASQKLDGMIQQYGQLAEASGDKRLIENAKNYKNSLEEVRLKLHQLRDELVNDVQSSFENFFTELISGSKSAADAFKDFAKSIIDDISKIIAKMIAMYIIKKLLGFFFPTAGGGGDSGGFGDAGNLDSNVATLATGGPLDAGHMALVGEQGPELFVPRSSGVVIPNSQLGGLGGTTVVVNIDARGADASVAARIEAASRTIADKAAKQAVAMVQDRSRRV